MKTLSQRLRHSGVIMCFALIAALALESSLEAQRRGGRSGGNRGGGSSMRSGGGHRGGGAQRSRSSMNRGSSNRGGQRVSGNRGRIQQRSGGSNQGQRGISNRGRTQQNSGNSQRNRIRQQTGRQQTGKPQSGQQRGLQQRGSQTRQVGGQQTRGRRPVNRGNQKKDRVKNKVKDHVKGQVKGQGKGQGKGQSKGGTKGRVKDHVKNKIRDRRHNNHRGHSNNGHAHKGHKTWKHRHQNFHRHVHWQNRQWRHNHCYKVRNNRSLCWSYTKWCGYYPSRCHWWYNYCGSNYYFDPTFSPVCEWTYYPVYVQGVVATQYQWHLGLDCIYIPGLGYGVQEVEVGSPAALAGLTQGMIIASANGQALETESAMQDLMKSTDGFLALDVIADASGQKQAMEIQMAQIPVSN